MDGRFDTGKRYRFEYGWDVVVGYACLLAISLLVKVNSFLIKTAVCLPCISGKENGNGRNPELMCSDPNLTPCKGYEGKEFSGAGT